MLSGAPGRGPWVPAGGWYSVGKLEASPGHRPGGDGCRVRAQRKDAGFAMRQTQVQSPAHPDRPDPSLGLPSGRLPGQAVSNPKAVTHVRSPRSFWPVVDAQQTPFITVIIILITYIVKCPTNER